MPEKKISPCMGCPDRTVEPNCHSTCYDRYIPWAQENIEQNKRHKQSKWADNLVTGFNVQNIHKAKKRAHSGKR